MLSWLLVKSALIYYIIISVKNFILSSAPKPVPTQRNTNVLMMNFGALSKPCSVHTGDPVICSNDQCAAILSHISEIKSEKEGDSETKVYIALRQAVYIIISMRITCMIVACI